MINLIFNYLLKSSVCLILFVVIYRLLISNLTHFSWMRFYLLSSLILSLVLPLIIIPIEWHTKLTSAESFTNELFSQLQQTGTKTVTNTSNSSETNSTISSLMLIFYGLLIVYVLGVIYKAYFFAKNLKNIYEFIAKNSKVKEANYWIISFKNEMPAFSFLNYIFINNNYKNLSNNELQIIKNHEIVHVNQYHSLDIVLTEIVGIVFWFNPLINYLRRSLQEIHEYIVDEKIAGKGQTKKMYAKLLLNLASETKVFNLTTNFTGEYIIRRISMLSKPKSSSINKLTISLLVPLSAILLVSFSYIKNSNSKLNSKIKIDVKFGEILRYQYNMKNCLYRGVYLPLKTDTILKPMEIINMDNKLFRFLETETNPSNRTVELQFETGNKFTYADNSGRNIEFILNNENEVTGCLLTWPANTFRKIEEKTFKLTKRNY